MAGKSAPGAANKAEMIRSLFENSSDLMHVVGAGGLLKLVNPAWTHLLGWREDEVVGKPAIDFNHPDDNVGLRERFQKLRVGAATTRYSVYGMN